MHAVASLRPSGLVILMLVHVPVVVLMGFAWWLASGSGPPASLSRFVWARFVRDAAGERSLSLALRTTGVLVVVVLLARRSLTASLEAMVRAIRARWPEVFRRLMDRPIARFG